MKWLGAALALAVVGSACADAGSGGLSSTATPTQTPTSLPSAEPSLPSAGPEEPFRFAVIGDFGTGGRAQKDVAARMCKRRKAKPFDLVVTTGDNVYPDGDPDRFKAAFLDPYECLFDAGVRFRASLGNHDVLTRSGRPEIREDAFGIKKRNYIVRTGGVRFVIADSNPLDRAWLRRAASAEQGDDWTVVVFHAPVFSPGTVHGSTPGYRPGLPRLFRRKGVDLVLNGHDHIYTASKSLRRIRYVVTGGGGGPLYGCEDAWFVAECTARLHFVEVTVQDDRIVVRAVPARGRVFHRFATRGRD